MPPPPIMPMSKFVINPNGRFEHLSKAPIVEAVIDIRISSPTPPDEHTLRTSIENKFGEDYKFMDSRREFEMKTTVAPNRPPNSAFRDTGWKGLRFQADGGKYIAQFNRDGFALSRLEPYDNWEKFEREAIRLWEGYREFVNPVEILRLGVRYVNRIPLSVGEWRFSEYLKTARSTLVDLGLSVSGFMHQDLVKVPNHPYAINVITTVQPPPSPETGPSLIFDTDTFTTRPVELSTTHLTGHLMKMRWLKNKIFFDAITQKAKEELK